jgi:hypothetical protein
MARKENPTLHMLLALLFKCCQSKTFICANRVSLDETHGWIYSTKLC